jgi:hypothetical protein
LENTWKESGNYLIRGIIPEFSWKVLQIIKTSVRIIGVPADIRTGHLPNAREKRHRINIRVSPGTVTPFVYNAAYNFRKMNTDGVLIADSPCRVFDKCMITV